MIRRGHRSPRQVHVVAFAVAAIVMSVPANLLPVMRMSIMGQPPSEPTIYGGVVLLWQQGLWPLGLIVFTASILVPLFKLSALGWLLWCARRRRRSGSRVATRLYTVINAIGRWSMLDVFLVAFLCGAVRFGQLATVQPRAGIVAFAAVVVCTVLAAESFDPRWLWNGPSETASQLHSTP